MLKKRISLGMILGTTVLLMGMSVPSCPGQQAMQKQIDDLGTKQSDLLKGMGGQTGKIQALEKEVNEAKESLNQVAEVLKTHKATIEQLQGEVEMLKAAAAKKAPVQKKRR